jgi:hypothetical protein
MTQMCDDLLVDKDSAIQGFRPPVITKLSTPSGGRRPKSAKARNRGRRECDSSAAAYGNLATDVSWKSKRFAPVQAQWEHNLNVTARILLNGDLSFVPTMISTG